MRSQGPVAQPETRDIQVKNARRPPIQLSALGVLVLGFGGLVAAQDQEVASGGRPATHQFQGPNPSRTWWRV
jgi:hypothetical protein